MFRSLIAIAVLVILPSFCSAATYDCVVKQSKAKSEGKKDLWSGKIVLKDGMEGDAAVFIIKKNGEGISLGEALKNAGDPAAIQAAMKPYNGLLVIGLRKSGGSLDINLGHIDFMNTTNSAPMDVDGWASVETREIGVTDARRGLTGFCRLE